MSHLHVQKCRVEAAVQLAWERPRAEDASIGLYL